jgi:hypothetical protein
VKSTHFSVKECLHGYTEDALGTICEKWQLVAKNKPSRIRAVEKVLEDPLHVHRMLKTADVDTVRMLRLVTSHGAVLSTDLLGVHGLYTLTNPLAAVMNAAHLGLLLACPDGRAGAFSFAELSREYHADMPGVLLTTPELVGRLVPNPQPLGIRVQESPEPDAAAIEKSVDTSTYVLLEMLRIVDLLSPRVTNTGALHKSDETRAQDLCKEAGLPAEALSLGIMSAQGLGCIEIRDGHFHTLQHAERWVELSRADRTRELFHACLNADEMPDVKLFLPQIYDALDKHMPRGSLRRTYHRKLVTLALSELRRDAWYKVDDLVETLFRIDSNVLYLNEKWRAIQSNMHEISNSWRERQWELREHRLFAWMIRRLLRDLGMVTLACEETYFSITDIGWYALGLADAPSEDPEATRDALVVQPDFEVIVYADRCPPKLRRKLDLFCERIRSGVVSTYKLTQESVYRGVRSGITANAFLGMLDQFGRHAVPENVREHIEGWERKSGVISVHTRVRLLECRTAVDADSVAAQCEGSRRIGERFVLLNGTDAPGPVMRIDYVQPKRACIQQEDGLQIRVPWNRSDLFVERNLAGLGDIKHDPSGDLIMTLSRVKLGESRDWGLVAAQLEALSDQPLSARFKMALRAWSGDLGSVSYRTATLIRFEDPDTCSSILDIPELAAMIEGRVGLFTLVVKNGQLPAFRTKLRKINLFVEAADAIADPHPPDVWAAKWLEEHQPAPEAPAQEAQTACKEKPAKRYEKALPSYSPRIIGEVLSDAIARRRPVLIEYQPAWSSEPTVRRVDPVTLDTSGSVPSLSGYCHTHKGPRTFKLAQIIGIRVLEGETY